MTLALTFDVDLEKFTQGQNFRNISIKENYPRYACKHRAYSIVGVKGQGRAKGQIHLIGYNFASNCHIYFKLVHILVYKKPHQIWPWPWLLTLTLKSSPKVNIFETCQLRKTWQNMHRE